MHTYICVKMVVMVNHRSATGLPLTRGQPVEIETSTRSCLVV